MSTQNWKMISSHKMETSLVKVYISDDEETHIKIDVATDENGNKTYYGEIPHITFVPPGIPMMQNVMVHLNDATSLEDAVNKYFMVCAAINRQMEAANTQSKIVVPSDNEINNLKLVRP